MRAFTPRLHTARRPAVLVLASATALLAAACGSGSGSSSSSDSGSIKGQTITYWASNQGASIAADQKTLAPVLAEFTKETGVKVKLEVVGWNDLLNRIMAATSSGDGPDVVNIGNTWSASLQATGAFLPISADVMKQIGDTGRFLPGALAATGAPGKDPMAVPIYSMAYAMYYNKAEFKAAGISAPPTTWDQFIADGKKLTGKGKWGVSVEGAQTPENAHHAFTFSAQYGGSFFDSSGKPTFDTPQNIKGIEEYVNFLGADKIANPSDAENSNGTEAVQEFATGKSAMLLWQAASTQLQDDGMNAANIGIAPIPFPANPPAGAKHVDSIVAGINLATFANTKHKAASLAFMKFMTSKTTQTTLNKAYGSLPSVTDAYDDPAFQTPTVQVIKQTLNSTAAPMPAVATEAQFETVIGTAMKNLFADAASGKPITDSLVADQLKTAQQQLQAGG